MSLQKIHVLAAVAVMALATVASAETRSLVKSNNFFQTSPAAPAAPTSPWFNLDVAGGALSPAQDVNAADQTQGHTVSFKPSVAGTQAGTVSSVTVAGTYSIKGYATAANNFLDLNGIPSGITITFKTTQTFSVDSGFLTLSPTAGNGLGIAPAINTSSTLDVGETLHVGAMEVSDIAFTGSTPGYVFSNPTVANFGVTILRSGAGTDFTEASETAGLYSLPAGATPTIGFGVNGTGTVQSNVNIDNGFPTGNAFPRIQGPWDFKVLAGSMGLRGINFQYDLGFDIVPAPPAVVGDYNANGVVDAADYVIWRKGDLAADGNGDLVVDQLDYDVWRANFGNPGAGAGSGLSSAAVPEPGSIAMVLLGLIGGCAWRRGSR